MATNKETPSAATPGETTVNLRGERSYTPEEVDSLLREVTRGLGNIQLKPTGKSLNTSHRDCRLIRPAQSKGNQPLRAYRTFTKVIDIISKLGKKISRDR
ncbi:hypothetical protein HMPREF1287_01185 [Corynebacterium sp. KPL1986]|nr:hypothetical protein HMPREF1293_02014 [Corynebacterium sp. KPL1996]ERS44691.1 hypothetical protein HMPREF1287_01185 [Corynebacterium sp. KPL1986]ERS72616.1 hypothetical protein HMPREF1295_01544 [Corynebacterium sp. KPL1998]ERS73925.1 hypothetical protein HMPREF1300_00907 [Corynebacterium sp. KPL2004]